MRSGEVLDSSKCTWRLCLTIVHPGLMAFIMGSMTAVPTAPMRHRHYQYVPRNERVSERFKVKYFRATYKVILRYERKIIYVTSSKKELRRNNVHWRWWKRLYPGTNQPRGLVRFALLTHKNTRLQTSEFKLQPTVSLNLLNRRWKYDATDELEYEWDSQVNFVLHEPAIGNHTTPKHEEVCEFAGGWCCQCCT